MPRRRSRNSISELRRRLDQYQTERFGLPHEESAGAGEKGHKKEAAKNVWPGGGWFTWSWKSQLFKTAFSLLVFLLVFFLHDLDHPAVSRTVQQLEFVLNWDPARDLEILEEVEYWKESWDQSGEHSEVGEKTSKEPAPYPLPLEGELLDEYGLRVSPRETGVEEMHFGVDISGESGDSVKAVLPGRVQQVEETGVNYRVVLEHGESWSTVYEGLQQPKVTPGEDVPRGIPVGELGEPGPREVPHLHFELRWEDYPVDPLEYLDGWEESFSPGNGTDT